MVITAAVAFAGVLYPASAHSPLATEVHSAPFVFATAAAPDEAKVSATKAVLRDLWMGHVFWIRNVVVAEMAGESSSATTAEEQVVANARAIAASIEPFYGQEAKDQFYTLLSGHYSAVKAFLEAVTARAADGQSEAVTMISRNASEIAVFLSTANPYLPKDTVEALLQAHGGHHIAQVQQLAAKDYAGEARTWADMTQHIYLIADATADALARQFSEKF
jgi:hypothetical protein